MQFNKKITTPALAISLSALIMGGALTLDAKSSQTNTATLAQLQAEAKAAEDKRVDERAQAAMNHAATLAASAPESPAPDLANAPATQTHSNVVRVAGQTNPLWRLEMRGYGHGVGLSQNGAKKRAEAGQSAQQILSFYYPNTKLQNAGSDGQTVRILVSSQPNSLAFQANWATTIRMTVGAKTVARPVATGQKIIISRASAHPGALLVSLTNAQGQSRVLAKNAQRLDFDGPTMQMLDASMTGISGESFAGKMHVRRDTSGGVLAVNTTDMASYLRGVVQAEMPSSWHQQALNAQAVSARTYALRGLSANPAGSDFDLFGDTRHQAYRGAQAVQPAVARAVAQTRNQALYYNGELISAVFSASNGGATASSKEVWGTENAYLQAAADPFDTAYSGWQTVKAYTPQQLDRALRSVTKTPVQVRASLHPQSKRMTGLKFIYGDGTNTWVSGEKLRYELGVSSNWFRLINEPKRVQRS